VQLELRRLYSYPGRLQPDPHLRKCRNVHRDLERYRQRRLKSNRDHSVLVDQAPFFSKNNGFKFFDDTSFNHGQTFRIYVTNPSTFTVTVNVSIDIFDDGGGAFVAHLTGSAVVAPGQSTIISIQWSPPQVPNQYSFVGKVTYSSGSFVTGTIGTKSGFFQITAP